MAEVLRKHRMIFVILSLIVIAAVVWVIWSRQNSNKTPMRGVFVKETYIQSNYI